MSVDCHSEEGRLIRQFIPLTTLPFDRFEHLCKHLSIMEAEDGAFLFKRGDNTRDLFFLLHGSINLQLDSLKIETINAGSDAARFALAHQIPRKVNGIANGKIRFLRMNPDMMNSIPNSVQSTDSNDMILNEQDDTGDWMTTLLKSPVFRMLPPANLQKILISLQEVRFEAGEIIIQQGDVGDFYYIIKKGVCAISRKPTPNAKEIRLGQLSDLDTFGEDALISGQPRNVSITAANNVVLFRLGKQQFLDLIKQPALKYVDYAETQDLLNKGAELIDVREPDEFLQQHLPKSLNIPFFTLRMQMKSLNRQKPIIVVCRNGKNSETASFILIRHKFNALVLKGGIEQIPADKIQGQSPANPATAATMPHEPAPDAPKSAQPPEAADPTPLLAVIEQLKRQCRQLETENKALQQQCSELKLQLDAAKAGLESKK